MIEPDARRALMSRRCALALLAAGIAVRPLAAAKATAWRTAALSFRILREGTEIGEHRVHFWPRDGRSFEVVTEIEVEIRLALFTVYRFRKRVVEVWQAGRMRKAEIRTEDQGEVRAFVVREASDGLELRGTNVHRRLPPDCLTDVDFWNAAITERAQVLDTWTGDMVPLSSQPGALELVELGSIRVPARPFHLRANRGRSGTVWYTEDGTWVRGHLRTRGERLDYLARLSPLFTQSRQT